MKLRNFFLIGCAALLLAAPAWAQYQPGTSGGIQTFTGVTAGVITASKPVVVDVNKDVKTFRNVYVLSIQGTAGSGLNQAGTNVSLAAGIGTGTGASGALIGQVAPPGTSGSGANSLATAFSFGGLSYSIGGYAQVSGGAVASNSTIAGVNGTGTNQVGGNLTLTAGLGTGTGTAGTLTGQVGPPLGTGSTQATAQNVFNFAGTSYSIGGYSQISGGAAAAASTITGVNGVGTDQAGGSLTLAPGAGSGAGGTGTLVAIQRNLPVTTGAATQNQAPGLIVCPRKTLSTSTGTAQAVANVAVGANGAGSIHAWITVTCNDGTNFDSNTVDVYQAYVDKASSFTFGTPTAGTAAAANNSGSCTVVPTFVANGTGVDVKVTPAFTTIVPTAVYGYTTLQNNGDGAVTCQ